MCLQPVQTEVIFAHRKCSIHQLILVSGPVALSFAHMINEHLSNFTDELGARNNSRKKCIGTHSTCCLM